MEETEDIWRYAPNPPRRNLHPVESSSEHRSGVLTYSIYHTDVEDADSDRSVAQSRHGRTPTELKPPSWFEAAAPKDVAFHENRHKISILLTSADPATINTRRYWPASIDHDESLEIYRTLIRARGSRDHTQKHGVRASPKHPSTTLSLMPKRTAPSFVVFGVWSVTERLLHQYAPAAYGKFAPAIARPPIKAVAVFLDKVPEEQRAMIEHIPHLLARCLPDVLLVSLSSAFFYSIMESWCDGVSHRTVWPSAVFAIEVLPSYQLIPQC